MWLHGAGAARPGSSRDPDELGQEALSDRKVAEHVRGWLKPPQDNF